MHKRCVVALLAAWASALAAGEAMYGSTGCQVGRGKHIHYLDRHAVDCGGAGIPTLSDPSHLASQGGRHAAVGDKAAERSKMLVPEREVAKPTPSYILRGFRYGYNGCATPQMRFHNYCEEKSLPDCIMRYTDCKPMKAKTLQYLDRHPVDCGDRAMASWRVVNAGCVADELRIEFVCCIVGGYSTVNSRQTSCSLAKGKKLQFLDRHRVLCKPNEVLKSFHLIDGDCPADFEMVMRYECHSTLQGPTLTVVKTQQHIWRDIDAAACRSRASLRACSTKNQFIFLAGDRLLSVDPGSDKAVFSQELTPCSKWTFVSSLHMRTDGGTPYSYFVYNECDGAPRFLGLSDGTVTAKMTGEMVEAIAFTGVSWYLMKKGTTTVAKEGFDTCPSFSQACALHELDCNCFGKIR
eukprot:gene943-1434_t